MSYIIIEGVEACGKSTQAALLAAALKDRGADVLLTKEPGSPHDSVCVEIRKLLLSPENMIADRAALLLFLADRAQHMEVIKKALDAGTTVISDRSSLSTFVYHAAKMSCGYLETMKEIAPLLDFAQQIRPDINFICNANLEWSLEQLRRRASLDRIEQFDVSFHQRTHELFSKEVILEAGLWFKCIAKSAVMLPAASENSPQTIHTVIIEDLKYRGLI